MADRILRFPEVIKRTSRSRNSIVRAEQEGRFPQRVQIGANAIGWRESEVEAWIANRPTGPVRPRGRSLKPQGPQRAA